MPANRREFLLTLAGSTLGTVMLSFERNISAAPGELPTIRLVTAPRRQSKEDGTFLLVWSEETADGIETMMWHAETPEEIEEATAFYEAAKRHEGVEGVEQPPKTVAGKVGRWLRDLLEPDPRRRTEEEWSLLRAIVANPDDDETLFRYADWLTEQGSPQGEFIRVDCALEGMPPDDPRRPPLDARWSELYDQHGKDFVAPLQRLGIAPVLAGTVCPALMLRRGVIGAVEIEQPGIIPEKMDDLFALAPLLRELSLDFEGVRLAEIARRPQMAQIESLGVQGIDAAALRTLAESPHSERIRELNVSFNPLGPDAGAALAKGRFLPKLRALELRTCRLLTKGVAALTAPNAFEQLKTLDLADNGLDGGAILALVRCTSLRNLETLDLGDNSDLGESLPQLAGASFAGTLRELDLGSIRPAMDFAAFAQGSFPQLETLTLSVSDMDDDGLAALAQAPWFAGLRDLKLGYNKLTARAADILAQVPFTRLERLDLTNAPLGDAGLARLTGSPHLATLRDLEILSGEIGPEGIRALTTAALPALKRLRIDHNPIGAEGAQFLAAAKNFELNDVWVDRNSIGERGRKLLKDRYGDAMSLM